MPAPLFRARRFGPCRVDRGRALSMNDVATARIGSADTAAPARFASLGDGLNAAEAARARGEPAAALEILTGLRAAFPDQPVPVLRAASILSQLRRFDEAEALLAEG